MQTVKIVIFGLCTSLSIELIQLLFMIGVCDIDDIILNTFGALLGVCLWKMVSSGRFSSVISKYLEIENSFHSHPSSTD